MIDLAALLEDLGAQAEVRAFVEDLAARRPVAPERQSDYVSLRPGSGGPIAVYVHKAYLSVAQPPAVAELKAAQVPGARTNDGTTATTYVELTVKSLVQAPQSVLTLCSEALEWRSTMLDTSGTSGIVGGRAERARTCPECGLQHGGECW